jgi:hypothetical protein
LGDPDHVFPEVLERAQHWISATTAYSDIPHSESPAGPSLASPDDSVVALHEGFVAVNLLDDLLTAVTHVPARVNVTGTLAKVSTAHLDVAMPRSDIDLQSLVTWAVNTPLVSIRLGALQVASDRMMAWKQMSHVERWLWLVATWRERIPPVGRHILRSTTWTVSDLEAAAEQQLIVNHAWIMPALTEALATARLLGLVRGAKVSPVAVAVLDTGLASDANLGRAVISAFDATNPDAALAADGTIYAVHDRERNAVYGGQPRDREGAGEILLSVFRKEDIPGS